MLEKLSKYHTEWIRMVKAMGGDEYTEDIVQEMYIYIYTKKYNALNDEGEVNKFYVWRTLHSILMNYFNQKNKIIKVPIDELQELECENKLKELEAFNELSLKVDYHIQDWHWFDKEIFEWYRHSGLSIRKMAEKTNISWVTIFNTLKDCKIKIKNELKDDYEKYKKETF